uniref:RH2 domain-containing protein n=1 Tax=Gongylonema pulchrum TaxID=637853 RepID=A0A183EF16_9BILA
LDSQLDHLNQYMDKVEERIKAHNEKLMITLRQQKEEREKKRRSFHEENPKVFSHLLWKFVLASTCNSEKHNPNVTYLVKAKLFCPEFG